MTREQVIKGLECCASNITCQDDCPYYLECTDDQQALMKDALALIREQQEEIQRLCDALKPEPLKEEEDGN